MQKSRRGAAAGKPDAHASVSKIVPRAQIAASTALRRKGQRQTFAMA